MLQLSSVIIGQCRIIAIAIAEPQTFMPKIMQEKKVQLRWSILPKTKESIQKMAIASHREPGQMIDYLVELARENKLIKIEEPEND